MKHDIEANLTPAGKEIIDALTEFRDASRDGGAFDWKFTVRTMELDLRPTPYTSEDVKSTRLSLKVSQGIFARLLGVSGKTVSSWEQGDRVPSPMACRFMDEINHSRDHWIARLNEAVKSRGKGPAKV